MSEPRSATVASPPDERIAAGEFGAWLRETLAALRGHQGSRVPCGDCVGCCVSSYFIPIRPEDRTVLDRVPAANLTRTAGEAGGQWVMGYREDGTCPMFDGRGCSIYRERPETCRDYDCRVFVAAGLLAGGDDKAVINRRVRAWQFSYASDREREQHAAVVRAAEFIATHRAAFPSGRAPTIPMGIAVLALKSYRVFMDGNAGNQSPEITARAITAAQAC